MSDEQTHATAGLGKVIAVALSAVLLILGTISIIELTKGSGAEDEAHHINDSISFYKSNVSYDALDGIRDTQKALIRVVGEKKFQDELR